MKKILTLSVMAAFAAVPSFAIIVNGDISDWNPGNVLSGPIVYTTPGASFQMLQYGATVQDGTLYAFVKAQSAMGVPGGTPSGKFYPGVFIDIDNSTATQVAAGLPSWAPGVDVNVEVDYDNDAIPTGGGAAGHAVNFWGTGNDWGGSAIAAFSIDAHNAEQTVFEWSIPVSEIVAAVANTDGATALPVTQWKMYVGAQGGPTWGYTVGEVVPEPGTLALLMGAGLALLGRGKRRRV